ncbi:MAG: hypothetical protein KDC88_17270, partial [Ignavibacteriae bacterium]|nr:hypothetical protein [Ignavibacteriota bacterium]
SFTSLATSGIGVRGFALNSGNVANYGGYFRADGKFGSGVYAWSSGESGYGVYGYASNNGDVTNYGGFFTANGNYGRGVYSFVNGTNAVGVYGEATNSGDVTNYGGYFLASGNSGQAVYGSATNTGFVYNYGGYFAAAGTYGRGVYGLATGASGSGVYGESNSTTGNAIFGYSTGSNGNAVYGYATGTRGAAIRGYASNTGSSTNYGGYFEALANNGRGIYASCTTGYAGYFLGNVLVNGYIYKSGGSFKIDHPLDPANKNLYHSFVESPDMMNIYNGNILTDESGNAQIKLPDWFEALNKDFRYQLTVIGEFAQAIVSEKIKDNKFTIKTNKPNVEVSWQITGIRHDAFANANRIPVEEMKPEKERGKYIHPEAFNMPKTSGIAYDEKMELEKIKMEEEQLKMAEERIKMEEIRKKEEQRVNVARLKIEKERNMSQELGPEINVKK